jgi:hypothetical protein
VRHSRIARPVWSCVLARRRLVAVVCGRGRFSDQFELGVGRLEVRVEPRGGGLFAARDEMAVAERLILDTGALIALERDIDEPPMCSRAVADGEGSVAEAGAHVDAQIAESRAPADVFTTGACVCTAGSGAPGLRASRPIRLASSRPSVCRQLDR